MSPPTDAHGPMFGRPWAWALLAVLLLALPAMAVWWRSPPALERYTPLPGFSLLNQQDQTLTSLDLRGQVVLVNFIFTRCPDVCPLLSARMAWLRRNLPAQALGGHPIVLVSITVDPEWDRVPQLAAYAERWGAQLPGWQFLTGDPEQVRQVIADFQQVAEVVDRSGEVPAIAHSERILLIDPAGVVRGFYPSDEDSLEQLRRDAHRLARSAEP